MRFSERITFIFLTGRMLTNRNHKGCRNNDTEIEYIKKTGNCFTLVKHLLCGSETDHIMIYFQTILIAHKKWIQR